jgi:hypothetical protein
MLIDHNLRMAPLIYIQKIRDILLTLSFIHSVSQSGRTFNYNLQLIYLFHSISTTDNKVPTRLKTIATGKHAHGICMFQYNVLRSKVLGQSEGQLYIQITRQPPPPICLRFFNLLFSSASSSVFYFSIFPCATLNSASLYISLLFLSLTRLTNFGP